MQMPEYSPANCIYIVWHLFAEGRLNCTCMYTSTHPHIHTHAHTCFPLYFLNNHHPSTSLPPPFHTYIHVHVPGTLTQHTQYIALHPDRHSRVHPSSWSPNLPWQSDRCDQCYSGPEDSVFDSSVTNVGQIALMLVPSPDLSHLSTCTPTSHPFLFHPLPSLVTTTLPFHTGFITWRGSSCCNVHVSDSLHTYTSSAGRYQKYTVTINWDK